MEKLDWAEVKEIYIEGIKTKMATFEIVDNILEYDEWINKKIKDACLVYIADKKVKGWASLSPASNREVYRGVAELSVYVSSKTQGRGVGSELIQAIIDYTEANNIWTIQSSIFPSNTPSILLHKKFDFREIGYREKIAQIDGVWKNNVLFERRSNSII